MAPSAAGARQEVPTAGPGLPPPGPEGDSGERMHGAWSGERRWEDIETHMWVSQQKPGDSRAPPLAQLIPQGTRSRAAGARLQAGVEPGTHDTRCILQPEPPGEEGPLQVARAGQDGFSQVGPRVGLMPGSPRSWSDGGGGVTALWEPHVSSRQTQADPGTPPPHTHRPGPHMHGPGPRPQGAVLADAAGSPSAHSSMTTRELQEYWRGEKGSWKPVKLLFEIASARIEQEKLSRFVVSTGAGSAGRGFPSLEGLTHTHPQFCWGRCWGTGPKGEMACWARASCVRPGGL